MQLATQHRKVVEERLNRDLIAEDFDILLDKVMLDTIDENVAACDDDDNEDDNGSIRFYVKGFRT